MISFNPFPGAYEYQLRALKSKKPIVAMVGGSGGGKTITGPRWLLSRHAMDTRTESVSLAVSPTYALAKKTTLPKIEKTWQQFADQSGGQCTFKKNDYSYTITWRNGNTWTLYTGTADKPDSYEGVHATAGVWGDELGQDSVSLLAWEALQRRATLYEAQILLTTTPYNESWLKELISGELSDAGDVDYIKFKSSDNPKYSKERLAKLRRSMPLHRFKMMYEGEFTQSPLVVYPSFADCVVDELPAKFDVVIAGMDWGSTNATALYLIGLRGDSAYVFNEFYQSGKTSDEKYSHVAAVCKQHRVAILYVDPAAAQVSVDLVARGVPAVAADNSVRDGIHRVQNLIEAGRLKVHSACYNLIDEAKRYKWRTDSKGNVIEVPIKQGDHGMDAIRYPLYTYGEWKRSGKSSIPKVDEGANVMSRTW